MGFNSGFKGLKSGSLFYENVFSNTMENVEEYCMSTFDF